MTQPKNLSEFFATSVLWGIACHTKEQAENLGRAFDAMGMRWASGSSYVTGVTSAASRWDKNKTDTVFLNTRLYASADETDANIIPYTHFQDEIETTGSPFVFVFKEGGK